MRNGILKVIAGLLIVAVIIECSALLATVYASRRIAAELQRSMTTATSEEKLSDNENLDGMKAIDFCNSVGITESKLLEWFDSLKAKQNLDQVRLVLTLANDSGHCLVDSPVALQWAGGIEWTHIGSSGLAEFALSAKQIKSLKVIVPEQYQRLQQRTFSMGDSYERPPRLVGVPEGTDTVNDDLIQQELFRNLQEVRAAESVFSRLNAAETLRRPESFVDIAADQSMALASEQIHQQRRSSVVVVGMLHPDGMISQGTGFVINSTGVIVTNFHVVHKPEAVAAGILTSDHRFFEVQEFLAGNPSDDLALIRVDAAELSAIPLAERNAKIGAELLAITHPDSHYFSMTFGRTTRYFQTTRHAVPSLRMGVTADFSEGSSGGPLLDMFGNVVGVVSATRGDASQMVHREAIPVSSLRRLTGNDSVFHNRIEQTGGSVESPAR